MGKIKLNIRLIAFLKRIKAMNRHVIIETSKNVATAWWNGFTHINLHKHMLVFIVFNDNNV